MAFISSVVKMNEASTKQPKNYDTSNSSNFTSEFIRDFLRNQDDKYAISILPVILFLVILMLTGLIGNILVCLVYMTKITRRTTTRSFILSLAVLDLINCLISIPFDIIDMRHRHTFGEYEICPFMKLFQTFISIASGSVLLAVAADRYKKICRPLKSQMTTRMAIVSVFVCCVLSLLVSLPAWILYGGRTVTTDNIDINGTDCSLSDEYIGTVYHIGYLGGQFMLFLGVTIGLVVLYSLIWGQVSRQRKFRDNMSPCQTVRQEPVVMEPLERPDNSPSTYEDTVSSGPSLNTHDIELKDAKTDSEVCINEGNTQPVMDGQDELEQSTQSRVMFESGGRHGRDVFAGTVPSDCAQLSPAMSKGAPNDADHKPRPARAGDKPVTSSSEKVTRRMTFILFMVTLMFVLSFLPHLCLIVLASVRKQLVNGLTGASLIAFTIFQRSYFFQSVSNPLIYSFFNPNFRRELKLLTREKRRISQ